MNNGHEKLIAKIQHFFDVLKMNCESNGANAVTVNLEDDKLAFSTLYKEYEKLASHYQDVFKEFLYNGDDAET